MNVPTTPPIREPTTPSVCAARSDDVCREDANVLLSVLIEYTHCINKIGKFDNREFLCKKDDKGCVQGAQLP